MKTQSLISHIRQQFAPETAAWLAASLKQEPLAWAALQEPDFSELVFEILGIKTDTWSLGAFALLKLGEFALLEKLRNSATAPLEIELRQRAIQAYDKHLRTSSQAAISLEQAGLLAIALRERYRRSGSWQAILAETKPQLNNHWRLPYTSVYGLLPEPQALTMALAVDPAQYDLLIHIILSQPMPDEQLAEVFQNLSQALPEHEQVAFLKRLKIFRKVLAVQVVYSLLSRYPSSQTPAYTARGEPVSTDERSNQLDRLYRLPLYQRLDQFLYLAEMHELADEYRAAIKLYQHARRTAVDIQGMATAQRAVLAAAAGDPETSLDEWLQAQKLGSISPETQAQIANHLIDHQLAPAAKQVLELERDHPAIQIANARLIAGQNPARAVKLASEAAARLKKNQHTESISLFEQLARIHAELANPGEAAAAISNLLAVQPANPDFTFRLAVTQKQMGDLNSAIDSASMAVCLAPENRKFRRLLAAYLEERQSWAEAVVERRAVLVLHDAAGEPDKAQMLDDMRSLANCAVQAGLLEEAVETSTAIINLAPQDGIAHVLLGKAAEAKGEIQAALDLFQKASQMAPYQPETWLSLARVYETSGMPEQALETLRTASQAVPDAVEIQLALGEKLMETETPSQAVSVLRKAADLSGLPFTQGMLANKEEQPRRIGGVFNGLAVQVAMRLGEVLFRLGHYAEARQALEIGFKAQPERVDLARKYAECLIELGEAKAALSALAVVVQSKPEDIAPYLVYASILLESGQAPETAIQSLETVLEKEPENAEAVALMAEALAAAGSYPAALQYYERALESPLVSSSAWLNRLSLGLGHVSLKEGKPEIAIAAIENARQYAPNNAILLQALADAYQAAGLYSEALQAARRAIELLPSDPEMLLWFVKIAHQNGGEPGEILSAVNRAAQLMPAEAGILLKLASTQELVRVSTPARQTYQRIAQLENITLAQLHQASRGLLRLDDAGNAIACLERVRQAYQGDLADISAEVLTDLAQAYRHAGEIAKALQVVDEALQKHAGLASLHLLKAELHLEGEAPLASQACLEQTLILDPANTQALRLLINIHADAGRLESALEYALQWSELYRQQPDDPQALSARLRAGEIAYLLIRTSQAASLLEPDWQAKQPGLDPFDFLDYYALKAELALEVGADSQAMDMISRCAEIDAEYPRLLALTARILARQGQENQAAMKLKEARTLTLRREARHMQPRSLALAYMDLADWDSALALLETSQPDQTSPRDQLLLARLLVMRAEAQRLSTQLMINQHAPGAQALSTAARDKFENALKQVSTALYLPAELDLNLAPIEYLRWLSRGRLVFNGQDAETARTKQNELSLLAKLVETPADAAATITALHACGQVEQVSQVASGFPNNIQVLTQLSLALLDTQPVTALEAALSAVEHLPKKRFASQRPRLYALLALASRRVGEYQQAYQALQQALEEWPEEAAWHALAAELCDRLQDTSAAIQHLEKAAALDPGQLSYHQNLGRYYQNRGLYQRAIEAFQAATQIKPDEPYVWLTLAENHLKLSQIGEAVACAERAIQLSPQNLGALLLRAEIALKANDARGALVRSQTAVRAEPENPQALVMLARSLELLNRGSEALQVFDKALAVVDDALPVFLERAKLVRKIQGAQPAVQALEELAQRYPGEPTVLAPLAEALAEAGRSEEAFQAGQLALQNDPQALYPSEHARLHILIGRYLRKNGQLDQAVHHLSQAVTVNPDSLDAYLELARAHQDRRQHKKALETYQQAIQIAPEDARPYQQAGLVLKEIKEYQQAERMIRRAAELDPQDLSIQRQLGALVALNLVQNAS